YNKIIGHYEVPLNHPGRDRTSGRIWRIVPGEGSGFRGQGSVGDLSNAPVEDLIKTLAHPNITARMLAMDQLSDRIGKAAVEPLRAVVANGSTTQKIHGLWVLYRLGAIGEAEI